MPPLASHAGEPLAGVSRERKPLTGKHVVVVHPAWHSCGSHQVFVNQIAAYRSLGAAADSLAVADFPGWTAKSAAHRAYLAASQDLVADRRFYAGMPVRRIVAPGFLRALWQWLHGNAAAMLCATAAAAETPAELLHGDAVDLIHCNHFFAMPVALALKRRYGCPILLDTHDVQARQFSLRNEGRILLPPKAGFEAMLAIELEQMRQADLLVHLNDEEDRSWRRLLPDRRHALIYPTIKPMPVGGGGGDAVIVASANHPNYLSLIWFLNEVQPLAPDVPLRIIGNIDQLVRARAPALYEKHKELFCGKVDALESIYAQAGAVLLPTTSGHGISIKTIEALSSGAPLIATREAFRGMSVDPEHLGNVRLVSDAKGFAAALREILPNAQPEGEARGTSDTRRLYDELFAFNAYCAAIRTYIEPLLAGAGSG